METMGCEITPRDWSLGRFRIRSQRSLSLRKYRGGSFAEYEAPAGDHRALRQVERLDSAASGRGERAILVGSDADVREAIHNLNSIDIRVGRYLASRPGRKTVGTPDQPLLFAHLSESEPFSS